MGGAVGLTIREENGIIHNLETYTGSLGSIVDNIHMVNKEPDYIKCVVEKNDKAETHPKRAGPGLSQPLLLPRFPRGEWSCRVGWTFRVKIAR